MTPLLDDESRRAHKARNELHSALLVGGLGLVTAFSAWLLWSWTGVLVALVWIGALYAFAPRLPPEMIMSLYRAQAIDPKQGEQILYIVGELAHRAKLPAVPAVYVIPSMTLNAFATGTPGNAVVGITEGLLRKLSLRELAGVLAHELSHVRNNDLSVMSLADVMTRFTQALSYLAVILAIFNLPAWLLGDSDMPFSALLLLYLTPTIGSLLQLGLSRTREYDADLEAAELTGDPRGLAEALAKLERYQGRFWEDLMFPVPRAAFRSPRCCAPIRRRSSASRACWRSRTARWPRPSRWWRSRWCRWSAWAPAPCSRATVFRACGIDLSSRNFARAKYPGPRGPRVPCLGQALRADPLRAGWPPAAALAHHFGLARLRPRLGFRQLGPQLVVPDALLRSVDEPPKRAQRALVGIHVGRAPGEIVASPFFRSAPARREFRLCPRDATHTHFLPSAGTREAGEARARGQWQPHPTSRRGGCHRPRCSSSA